MYCFNPDCSKPQNIPAARFCQSCGRKLLLKERYRALRLLGQGSFTRAFLAVDEDKPSKPHCAIKQLCPLVSYDIKKITEFFHLEALLLKELGKHPQIPEFFASFEQDENLYLVEEFIDGVSLDRELSASGSFTEDRIRDFLGEFLPLLQFIHNHRVIHRCIRPSDIIRRDRDKKLCLIDFNGAKQVKFDPTEEDRTLIGVPGYMAPEQEFGRAVYASDLYSLGVTCIHLLTGQLPYSLDGDMHDFLENWRTNHRISDRLFNILDRLVKLDLRQRYRSTEEVFRDLNSPVMSVRESQQKGDLQCAFTLSPFGNGAIKQVLHQGKLFSLYLAELCGQEVCLKTPSLSLTSDSYYRSVFNYASGSETFYSGATLLAGTPKNGYEFPLTDEGQIETAVRILLAEAQTIQWTDGVWNHRIIGQGTLDRLPASWNEGDGKPYITNFLPVMVMPYHNAIPFFDLTSEEKRKLFPRMLPALWTALCQMYHGDLSESNILISKADDIFHLIDPGILLASTPIEKKDSYWPCQSNSNKSVFTTTAINYPILPPFADAGFEQRHFSEKPGELLTYLQVLADFNFRIYDPTDFGIFNLSSRSPKSLSQKTPSRHQPYPSDLLALGIIYYRILTGEELFLGREILPEKPTWVGELPHSALRYGVQEEGEVCEAYRRVFNILSEGYIDRELSKHNLSLEETRLISSLLNLQVRDREHLQNLLRELG